MDKEYDYFEKLLKYKYMDLKIVSKQGRFYLDFMKVGVPKQLCLGEKYWVDAKNKNFLWAKKGREYSLFLLETGDYPIKKLAKMSFYQYVNEDEFVFRMVKEDIWMVFSRETHECSLLGTLFCHRDEKNFWLFLKYEDGGKIRFISIHDGVISSLKCDAWSWFDKVTLSLKTQTGDIKLRIP